MKARHEFNSETEWVDYLRTYFAAMALQGLLAKYGTDYESACVKDSVGIADALIKALNND